MKIDVTQDDIDEGESLCCDSCPIALACQRALPGRIVSVHCQTADVDGSDVELPYAATEFVENFDNGDRVEPFSFELLVGA